MELFFKDVAIKHLKQINLKDLQKAKRKFEDLKGQPLLGKPLHGKLSGERSIRAWPLRIIYTFDSAKQIIEIITVDYRGNVYK